MEHILKIIVSICTISVVDVLIMQLIPNGKLKGSVRIVLALVMFATVAFKIGNIRNIDFSQLYETDGKKTQTYLKYTNSAFAQSLEENIKNTVDLKYETANSEVCVISSVNDNYEFEVINVMISVNCSETYEIKKYIFDEYKIDMQKIIVDKRG